MEENCSIVNGKEKTGTITINQKQKQGKGKAFIVGGSWVHRALEFSGGAVAASVFLR